MSAPFPIDSIQLLREGDYLYVIAEYNGQRRRVIRERAEGPISHNVSASGIQKAFLEAPPLAEPQS